jgi:1-acyl-sn-glycerol-3-phosphate acyltransferase
MSASFLTRAWREFPPADLLRLTLPHRAVRMLFAYLFHTHRRTFAEDLDRRDPDLLAVVFEATRAIGRRYFRARIEGLENDPPAGAGLLVGNHNGGFLTFDTYLTLAAIAERHGLGRAVHPLAHDFVFDDPLLREYALRFGAVRAGHGAAEHALRRGALVLVYPGGDLETFRPWSQRNRIVLGDRSGFVRLALHAGVPIVPVVSAGTHEQMIILTRGDRIARALRLHRWARTDVFPIAFSLPWGITSAFLPYIPLPAQTTIAFGAPIAWPELGPDAANDEAVVADCREQVERAMQQLLDRITTARRPWFGRRGSS